MTPEGLVKKATKALLSEFNIQEAKDAGTEINRSIPYDGWYYMPGQNGYGVKGVGDFMGHYKGFFFTIETKAPGKEPKGFQALQIKSIKESGGMVFVVDGEAGLLLVREWLKRVRMWR